MKIEDQVRAAVRAAIAQKISGEPKQVTEGVGSFLVKAFATFKGGAIGSTIGGVAGAGAGLSLAVILASIGIVGPAAIVVGGYGGAAAGWVAGLYKGANFGLNTARKVTSKESTDLANKLIDITKKRDDEFRNLSGNPEDTKTQGKIDSLTKQQMDVALKLRKAADFDKKRDLISNADYDFAMRLIRQAESGKLTYIES